MLHNTRILEEYSPARTELQGMQFSTLLVQRHVLEWFPVLMSPANMEEEDRINTTSSDRRDY